MITIYTKTKCVSSEQLYCLNCARGSMGLQLLRKENQSKHIFKCRQCLTILTVIIKKPLVLCSGCEKITGRYEHEFSCKKCQGTRLLDWVENVLGKENTISDWWCNSVKLPRPQQYTTQVYSTSTWTVGFDYFITDTLLSLKKYKGKFRKFYLKKK